MRNIINRALTSILIASTLGLALACVAHAEAQKPAAQAVKPAPLDKPATPVLKVTKTEVKTKTVTKTKAKRDQFGPFVPPPPPNIPTFSSIGQMGSIDMDLSGLSFLSEPELKSRIASHEIRLKNAESKLKDQIENIDEIKSRAKGMVELFDQGIISKKELENSSKEGEQAVADLEEAKGKVKDLELSVKAMKERLAVLQKRKAISKAITKPIGSSGSRKQNKSKSQPPSKQKSESKSSPAATASDKSKI